MPLPEERGTGSRGTEKGKRGTDRKSVSPEETVTPKKPVAAGKKAKPKLVLTRTGIDFEQNGVKRYSEVERAGFTYVIKDGKHYYYSTEKGENSKKVVKGYRSKLTVEYEDGTSEEFDCIERANGFKHIKPGTYTVIMTPRNRYRSNEELHIIEGRNNNNVFIHAAPYPCYLDGCIAPGSEVWEGYGVKNSRGALINLIKAMGGWDPGKRFTLEVKGEGTTAG